jgi:MFS family permease
MTAAGNPAPRATGARYVVLAALCLAAIIAYIQRNSIGAFEIPIREDLGLQKEQTGLILGSFFWAYALFQLPTGWLVHHWGSRRAICALCVVWSLLTAWSALTSDFWLLLLTRFGQGAAQAGIFPAATVAVSRWFPRTQRGLASGALGACMSVGGAVGNYLAGVGLSHDLGWRSFFALAALPGFAWAAAFYFWFRDDPKNHAGVSAAELDRILVGTAAAPPTPHKESIPWGKLLGSGPMWFICGQQFFRATGYIFFATWFPTFLVEARGLANDEAAKLTSYPLWGVVVGAFLGGFVADWLLHRTGSRRVSRQGFSVVSMVGCAACILAAWTTTDAEATVWLITLGAFVQGLSFSGGYAITIDLGGKQVATVFSLMNMAGNVGASLFPVVVPFLLRWSGNDWDVILFVFAGLYVGSAVCWLGFDANKPLFAEHEPVTPGTAPARSPSTAIQPDRRATRSDT